MPKNMPARLRPKARSRSGYSRHGKQPYVYSADLRGWHAAIKDNRARDAAKRHAAWLAKFGLKPLRKVVSTSELAEAA